MKCLPNSAAASSARFHIALETRRRPISVNAATYPSTSRSVPRFFNSPRRQLELCLSQTVQVVALRHQAVRAERTIAQGERRTENAVILMYPGMAESSIGPPCERPKQIWLGMVCLHVGPASEVIGHCTPFAENPPRTVGGVADQIFHFADREGHVLARRPAFNVLPLRADEGDSFESKRRWLFLLLLHIDVDAESTMWRNESP